MMRVLREMADRFLGRGQHSTAIPILDGALQPNQALEHAPVVARAPELDNLIALADGSLWCSSGTALLRLAADGKTTRVAQLDAPITCLAACPSGALAIGLEGTGLRIRGGAHDGSSLTQALCPVAALFVDEDTVLLANGSARFSASQWKHDLMNLGCSGSIVRVDLARGQTQVLAQGLAFPYGMALSGTTLYVTEAWKHRIIAIDLQQGGVRTVWDELPAYPARLVCAAQGGYWLACFAPRNALVEFVLREPRYRQRMVAHVDPRFWVAPMFAAYNNFRTPVQEGAIRKLAVLKPWAPSFSYGMVVQLDKNLLPVASWHSRADGVMHGVTSVCEHNGRVIAGVKGADCAVQLPGHQGGA